MAEEEKKSASVTLFGAQLPLPQTGAILDRLFAKGLTDLGNYLSGKRARNLVAHFSAVDESNDIPPPPVEPSVKQIEALSFWAEGASAVDDDTPELAAAWRAALERLRLQDPEGETILYALRSLSTSDLLLFLDIKQKNDFKQLRRLPPDSVKRLVEMRLLKDDFTLISSDGIFYFWTIMTGLLLLSLTYRVILETFGISLPPPSVPEPLLSERVAAFLFRLIFIVTSICLAISVPTWILASIRNYLRRIRITRAGHKLLSSYERYK